MVEDFAAHGMVFHSLSPEHEIRNSTFRENRGYGIVFNGKASTFKLINSTLQNNDDNRKDEEAVVTLRNTLFPGNYYLAGNTFENNLKNAFDFSSSTATILEMNSNLFLNNTGVNIADIKPSTSSNTIISKNTWCNNIAETSVIRFNILYITILEMNRNLFLNNTGVNIANIQSNVFSNTVMISKNTWHNNTAKTSVIRFDLGHIKMLEMNRNLFLNNTGENIADIKSSTSSNTVMISKNTWRSNTAETSVIRFDLRYDGYSQVTNFYHNDLAGNTVLEKYPLLTNFLEDKAVVLHIRGKLNITNNVFENPLSRYDFSTNELYQRNEIDARLNWWGSGNPDFILTRIFDFRTRNAVNMVNFLPYFRNRNMLLTSSKRPFYIFVNGSQVGGPVVRDVTLTEDNSPYLVTRDVIVHPNVTLVIKPGVHVDVLPYVGFHVYGKMEMAGEKNRSIQFNVANPNEWQVTQPLYPLRLVSGSTPWEGRVEVFYNNTWGTVCRDGWTNTNGDILCKQLGFQKYEGMINVWFSRMADQPTWLKNVDCVSGVHSDITSCPFQGWNVTCSSYLGPLAIRCNPGYWGGIRFRDIAEPSQLTHLKLIRGGYYESNNDYSEFVLRFDFQKQTIHDIEISNFGVRGVGIGLSNPGLTFQSITIDNKENNHYGVGLQFSTPPIAHLTGNIVNIKGIGLLLERNTNLINDDSKTAHVDDYVPYVSEKRIIRDLCNSKESETIIGEDSFLTFIARNPYSYYGEECVHVLRTASQSTVTIARLSSSYTSDVLKIGDNHPSQSNATTFIASAGDVFISGPGVIYIDYLRKRSTSDVKIYVLSSKGNEIIQYILRSLISKSFIAWHEDKIIK